MENMVESRALSFCYRGGAGPALHHITLAIPAGSCVMLCGKSGCGKTTFTRLLNGLSPNFFEGEMTGLCRAVGVEAGAPIEAYVPRVGSVFQNPKTQFFNVDTTAELAFPCENAGLSYADIRQKVEDCARRYDLEPLLGRSIFQLSGGEKQQIACGAASIMDPPLLVMDEPTSNLDHAAIGRLHHMIAQMKAQGITVVLAEHRIAWATDLVDRYFFFEEGRLAAHWPAAEFLALPSDRFLAMGLRAPDVTAHRARLHTKVNIPCPPGQAVLSTKGLQIGHRKKRPVRTVRDMALCPGQIVGLMGPNGAGKTTFAKTLCGLLPAAAGSVCWRGVPASARTRMRHSFLVMQDVNYQLFSDSVRQEVLLGAAQPERCDDVLQAMGLAPFAERHPMSLSGGQKQRVAIAAALLSGRELIVFDEPTSGLDGCHMAQVGKMLTMLKEQGRMILVITHDEELAADWCDRVILWDQEER